MLWDNSAENVDPCHCTSGKCCCCKSFLGSPMKQDGDLSLYESPDPTGVTSSRCTHQNKRRRPLEDVDSNSRDSGYGASCSVISPKRSFSSTSSMDDFLDICGLDDTDENAQLPGEFSNLISGSLVANEISPDTLPKYRRSISLPSYSPKARSCLFKKSDDIRCFKRPEPPTPSPRSIKRYKTTVEETSVKFNDFSLSANEDTIKTALQRSHSDPDLIGDFSKQFCLPLVSGKHSDLKSINPSTLVGLMKGEFQNRVASFKVVDCRFPYEYEGGHISGAINLYTKEQIMDELLHSKIEENSPVGAHEDHRRHILVFHCEFSSERGPNLLRFLRKVDRNHNMKFYPYLHFPEIYLLHGGYKNFYEEHPDLCDPNSYLPMLHPNHEKDLRFFRSKSKTFNKDNRSKSGLKSLSFKRL
ncbi:M-phase inducer phosphatase-like [Onthophagus taurus]|uniref:M-phase inducer phosphatase-like n=1 Tax=Onthophagus taurus TaxID=166361 RepID=UPI000C200BDF|nr:M-phase inducer phosphatase-like [Onthophagus taurus]